VTAGHERLQDGSRHDINRVLTKRVLPASVATTETSILETVLQYGTGKAAAIGQFAAGKTGTTSNYGDAWFVGWNSKYTVAVWVGYPNKLVPMTTAFGGKPVLGGTFPALIWHSFMTSALQIEKERAEHVAETTGSHAGSSTATTESSETSSTSPTATGPSTKSTGTGKSSPGGTNGEASTGAGTPTPEHSSAPTAPSPSHEAPTAPASPGTTTPPTSPSPTGGVSPGG